ncbi:hypothetical protein BKN14_04865 [Candidatus Gracilibacteria bacterium HOT-871]|nr:hypothetical protein BKN14_04865 [Candidatus Gracilibacteria bacterium HOT-871]RKW20473.1 MAG: hypothetical protein D8B46_09670 [Candidatus Gracilibacteria bacterium]
MFFIIGLNSVHLLVGVDTMLMDSSPVIDLCNGNFLDSGTLFNNIFFSFIIAFVLMSINIILLLIKLKKNKNL